MTFQQQTHRAFHQALQYSTRFSTRLFARHRLGIVAALVAALGGFGITAVAIAPLAPDASQLPRRWVTEAVEPTGIAAQLDALSLHGMLLRRSDVTRGTDTAGSLLSRLGVIDSAAEAFLRSDRTASLLLRGRGGKMVQAEARDDGSLVELVGRFPSDRPEQAKTHFTRMTLSRINGQWQARLDNVPYDARQRLASGSIRSSLFSATDEAGLPDAVASQLAEIFASAIDFHRELRRGDTFSVVYDSLTADGEPVVWNEGAGRITAAEFVSNGRAHHAVWFTPADGKGGYYGLDGQSRRRSFLASPMEFSRITSGFAQRFHPLLLSWRKHMGVDYGAPTGTTVRAVGDGVVEFAGWQNGYGNVVQVQHSRERETLYAHLSRINVRKGQRLEQGQTIGAVGSTGLSTGPHLHFEFRINGQHQDPLVIAKAAETVALDTVSRQKFAEMVRGVRAKLVLAETVSRQHARAD